MEFGVSIPHGKLGQHTDYEMVREAALECERLGFNSIYVSDHVVPRPNTPYPERDKYDLDVPYLECWTLLSALAVETTNVRLGTFTLCNSFRQPPSLLAKMASTLDQISGGEAHLRHRSRVQRAGVRHVRRPLPEALRQDTAARRGTTGDKDDVDRGEAQLHG